MIRGWKAQGAMPTSPNSISEGNQRKYDKWTQAVAAKPPRRGLVAPLVEKAGWTGSELTLNDVSITLSATEKQLMWRASESSADEVVHEAIQKLRTSIIKRLASDLGFVVLDGFPVHPNLTASERLFEMVASSLGELLPQTKTGETIFRVMDAGYPQLSDAVRGSKTASALPFHTDGSQAYFGPPPEFTALFVVAAAATGGTHRIVSAYRVCKVVAEERPDLLNILENEIWPFDRSFELLGVESDERVSCARVIVRRPNFAICFNPYYMQKGFAVQQKKPRPEQSEAIDFLETVCHRPGVSFEIETLPGRLVIENNHTTLHARTAYVNSQDVRRCLLRAWVRRACFSDTQLRLS